MTRFDTKIFLSLWARHAPSISAGAVVLGFLADLAIVKRPDSLWDNLYLLSLFGIAATCIVLLNRRTVRPQKTEIEESQAEPLILLFMLQFCFGGLASNLLILYGYSGTLSATALFLGILVSMLIGNEFLRLRYSQLRFNLAVFYTLLLTYCIIAVPTFFLHTIGTAAFVISSTVSLAGMALYLFLLSGTARLLRGKLGRRRIAESAIIIAGICIAFNMLYFFRLIPPVPLALKAIGIYHSVERTEQGYYGTFERGPWWKFWSETSGTYHAHPGMRAYCFSSIFAPTGLSVPIVHHWEWHNAASGTWESKAKVTFVITGGRSGGYYGYSIKALSALGDWRCSVKTGNGVLIGRTAFEAVEGYGEQVAQRL